MNIFNNLALAWNAMWTAVGKPSDQAFSPYRWSDNQMGHFALGVLVASILLHATGNHWVALGVVFVLAVGKEILDLTKLFTLRTLYDSCYDASFWMLGDIVAISLWYRSGEAFWTALSIGVVLYLTGVVPRAVNSASAARWNRKARSIN
jgi:hypothetical protein